MSFSVRERADSIATFRFTCVHLMETLADWTPSTPELEVKILFGTHLWDLAQHADTFGQRTHELRLALQTSRTPHSDFLGLLERIRSIEATGGRLRAIYDVALPALRQRYVEYLEKTDRLLDEPSVRILERALWDLDRLERDRQRLAKERPDLDAGDHPLVRALESTASSVEMIDFRAAPTGQDVSV